MRSREFITESRLLLEGGNMFKDAEDFDQQYATHIIKIVNDALAPTNISVTPIGSGATPTPGKISGDFDVMADEGAVQSYFKVKDAKEARRALRDYLTQKGFETAQSGINVHMLVPLPNGKKAQTDIMVTPHAGEISKFHKHNIPLGSKFKGTHKAILMSVLAKTKGMMWSPWNGLFNRTPDGKRGDLISNNIDVVARTLLGSHAIGGDLGSVESILAKLPQQKIDELMTLLDADPNWKAIT